VSDAEQEATAPEDKDQLAYIGGNEADAPEDSGEPPSYEDTELEPAGEDDDFEAGASAAAWRAARSLTQLRKEIDLRWPNRDHASDGTIGDAAHCPPGQPSSSDHCRNAAGVVRALDIDKDGIQAAWLAEHVRKLGANGDPRLKNGGYVIFNRRIASWSHGWRWRPYTGANPHTSHIHFSVSRDAAGYDKPGGWGVKQQL